MRETKSRLKHCNFKFCYAVRSASLHAFLSLNFFKICSCVAQRRKLRVSCVVPHTFNFNDQANLFAVRAFAFTGSHFCVEFVENKWTELLYCTTHSSFAAERMVAVSPLSSAMQHVHDADWIRYSIDISM